eukprot:13197548-Ditylum_brightwellii.AAC.1
MPCHLKVWNVTSKSGNPTRSVDVNDLIKDVRKKEVSLADCTFEDEEFRQMLSFLHGCTDPRKKYVLSALLLLVMQMIAWLDDAAHLRKGTLMVYLEFNFALPACMRWSKNISEERDAPHQIMLGSMNANVDILLSFGL